MQKAKKVVLTPQPTEPNYGTFIREGRPDGVVVPRQGKWWLYRQVPLGIVDDAVSAKLSTLPGDTILNALASIAADLTPTFEWKRRSHAERKYREVHLLLVNAPALWRPTDELAGYLSTSYPGMTVMRRVLLLGVQLRDSAFDRGWRSAIDSTLYTLENWTVPDGDYEKDHQLVKRALTGTGLVEPDPADFALAANWWNLGGKPKLPHMPCDDHLHLFADRSAARSAKRQMEEGSGCLDWQPDDRRVEVSFSTVAGSSFGFNDATAVGARWVSRLVEQGAVCISIRGKIEPAEVTTEEIGRNARRIRDDLESGMASVRSDRVDMLAGLEQVEAAYREFPMPTITDCRTIVAFHGRDQFSGYDPAPMGERAGVTLLTVDDQDFALHETMMGSHVRVSSHRRDFPIQTIAYSGIAGLSAVGDDPRRTRQCALLGFTERDRQPAWFGVMAAQDVSSSPLVFIAGASGSGKLLTLSTRIPTPSGWTTMGELKVGDSVLGRDGRPCQVTYVSAVNRTPELYRITLSDGQQILADADHQWVVSEARSRKAARRPKRRAAARRFEERHLLIAALEALAAQTPAGELWTVSEILQAVRQLGNCPWNAYISIYEVLSFMGCTPRSEIREEHVSRVVRVVKKRDPVILFPAQEALVAAVARWEASGRALSSIRADAGREVSKSLDPSVEMTASELTRLIIAADPAVGPLDHDWVRSAAREAGVPERRGFATVSLPVPESNTAMRKRLVFDAKEALGALADRLRQIHSEQPSLDPEETIVLTSEMVAEGLCNKHGERQYAIRLTEPIDLPEKPFPLDPYVLGAWLGDETSATGSLTSMDQFIVDEIVSAGFPVRSSRQESRASRYTFKGLWSALSQTGLTMVELADSRKMDKRIPAAYLRGSREQRLALLQGLMDTDGTISKSGACELTLSKGDLAEDALELARSLGIRSSLTINQAAITLTDPVTGEKTRKQCGHHYRIKFTTTQQVFRLPRKLERLPQRVRGTQNYLYVTSIEPVTVDDPDYEPGACIQVDSPDSTYLAAGMVPTHNTTIGCHLMDQWTRTTTREGKRTPVVFFNPAQGDDRLLRRTVQRNGGAIHYLDRLESADGILDPLRFSKDPEDGIDLSLANLAAVNPWEGSQIPSLSARLARALRYGVRKGATATLQALRLAAAELPIDDILQPVNDMLEGYPKFAAMCGLEPTGERLAVSDTITYIAVGNADLSLPPESLPATAWTMSQRVNTALVRAVSYGAMAAMRDRFGVFLGDEAWVFTSAGADELDRIGRVARKWNVLPVLMSQRITDALNIGLENFISRGLILPLDDPKEATSACQLFRLDPTEAMVDRITAKSTIGDGTAAAPNWRSMRHLSDVDSQGRKRVLRGTIALYADLAGRVVPVEVRLSPEFLGGI